MSKSESSSRYMPGLDGLRAIAVLAVIAYHLNFAWAPGGLLGVGMFFVLSGYLITDLLISEKQRTGRVDLKGFWIRRARRLLPGMLLMLAVVLLCLVLVDWQRLVALKGDFGSALTYTSNWYLIFHNVSYFESFGPPSPIGHLWSLSVEEQFYLLWPPLLLIGMKFAKQRGRLAMLLLLLAAASALFMAGLYQPGADPSRVYYGTDTRAFGLLIGAALAVVWPSRQLKSAVTRRVSLALEAAGLGGMLILLWMVYRTNEYDAFLYQGGLVVVSLVTAIVIASLAHPASRMGRWLGSRPLKWIGVRSYGIYLWHFPVIILTTPEVDTQGPNYMRIVLQLAFSFVLAALSYKYVEDPIRRGELGRWFRQRHTIRRSGKERLRKQAVALLSVSVLVALCVSCVGGTQNWNAGLTVDASGPLATGNDSGAGTHPSSHPLPTPTTQPAENTKKPGDKVNHPAGKPEATTKPKPSTTPASKPAATPVPTTEPKQPVTDPRSSGDGADQAGKPDSSAKVKVTTIGDSVMLDAQPYLEKNFPGIVVDGKVGRQMREAPDVIEALRDKGRLGDIVVIELGTNGPFTSKQATKLLDSLKDVKHILFVNSRVPRKWQDTVNDALAKMADDCPNAVLVDWYSASEGHDEYFGKDGVHLNKSGSKALASLILDNLPE